MTRKMTRIGWGNACPSASTCSLTGSRTRIPLVSWAPGSRSSIHEVKRLPLISLRMDRNIDEHMDAWMHRHIWYYDIVIMDMYIYIHFDILHMHLTHTYIILYNYTRIHNIHTFTWHDDTCNVFIHATRWCPCHRRSWRRKKCETRRGWRDRSGSLWTETVPMRPGLPPSGLAAPPGDG